MGVRGLILLGALAAGDPVDELIARLGSGEYEERARATAALKALGRPVEARLRGLRTEDAEVAWRRDEILEHLKTLHESAVLLTRVRVDGDHCEVLHQAGGEKPALPPWDRIVRLGVRKGAEEFVCAQRDVAWRDGDAAVLLPALRAEIARPFELGAPDAFHLLARAPLFPELVPALEERLKATTDPAVREACLRAIERQRRAP